MYFNTTNEQGESLKEAVNQAINQQERIVEFFKANKGREMTPVEVADSIFNDRTPLTSVRRAMTNASKNGLLVQTEKKKKGAYGRMNYCWKFNG